MHQRRPAGTESRAKPRAVRQPEHGPATPSSSDGGIVFAALPKPKRRGVSELMAEADVDALEST